jgi:hypothetical protein
MYRKSIIKSIQRGTITLTGVATATATVTAVVLANSVLRCLGFDLQTDLNVTAADTWTQLALTNTTTVTATRTGVGGIVRINFELVEYYPGVLKSVQRGTIALAAATNTATVTAVVVAKSACDFLGGTASDANAGEYAGRAACRVELTNTTTVTASRGVGTNTANAAYQVVEFT